MNSSRRNVRRAVTGLLTAAFILGVFAISSNPGNSVEWGWLQAHANEFYVAKGLISGAVVLMVIAHMMQVSHHGMPWDQQLRYFSWFIFTVLVTGASIEQAQGDDPVSLGNLGGLGAILFAGIAAAVSIREEARRNRRG